MILIIDIVGKVCVFEVAYYVLNIIMMLLLLLETHIAILHLFPVFFLHHVLWILETSTTIFYLFLVLELQLFQSISISSLFPKTPPLAWFILIRELQRNELHHYDFIGLMNLKYHGFLLSAALNPLIGDVSSLFPGFLLKLWHQSWKFFIQLWFFFHYYLSINDIIILHCFFFLIF